MFIFDEKFAKPLKDEEIGIHIEDSLNTVRTYLNTASSVDIEMILDKMDEYTLKVKVYIFSFFLFWEGGIKFIVQKLLEKISLSLFMFC